MKNSINIVNEIKMIRVCYSVTIHNIEFCCLFFGGHFAALTQTPAHYDSTHVNE